MRPPMHLFRRISRNHILIFIAIVVTVYGSFLASAFYLKVYSIGVLVLLIPFLEIRSHHVVLQLFALFFICIQICSIAVYDRLPYELLLSSQPLKPAFKHAFPIALGSCAVAHLIFFKRANLITLYALQFPLMLLACTWYIRMNLIMNNCQKVDSPKAVYIQAEVVQKCPVCCDIHELLVSFTYEDEKYQFPVEVHPKTFEQAKEGGKLNMTLHPGVYGWPWYHKEMKRRYK
ncbi:hypothetical protein [Sphingobacterium paramultivorum]|uniref:hypothetical protein n=1 Tax=Sphingobacterium paramultivorum TaxID=2886510 RepID=UPI00129C706E|nr:hypothetical protein [Sphingobacterium paramultivorum]